MTPQDWEMYGLLGVSLTATCASSTLARSLRRVSRGELDAACAAASHPDRATEIAEHQDDAALAAECLGVVLMAFLAVSAGFWIWAPDSGEAAVEPRSWPAVAAKVALVLSLTWLWIPAAIARIAGPALLARGWPIWKGMMLVAWPLMLVCRLFEGGVRIIVQKPHEEPGEAEFQDEIRAIVTEGQREGHIEEQAGEMIEGIIELRTVTVGQVMTRRTAMHAVQVDTPWSELVEYVVQVGHTRFPVYDEGIDDVVGILFVKDLLPELQKPDDARRPIRALLRKAHAVPESKAVLDLLKEFQHNRNHMAVVRDEFGGVAGLITIEDVLEEIVGEIADEYDDLAVSHVRLVGDAMAETPGRTRIEEVNAALGLSLPESEGYTTIGGFVLSELGRVPAAGESLTWQDSVRITVLAATRRSVELVRVEALSPQTQDEVEGKATSA